MSGGRRFSPRLHLSPIARGLPVVMIGIAVVLGASELVAAGLGQPVHVWAVVGWLALAVACFASPVMVGRHVLERPQPYDVSPDERAADEAVRRRSLLVLAGSCLALVAFATANLIDHVDALSGDGLGALLVALPAVKATWFVARTPAKLHSRRSS